MTDPIVEHLWDEIATSEYEKTFRMRVPGGWLYRHMFWANDSGECGQCMVSVPDPQAEPISPRQGYSL